MKGRVISLCDRTGNMVRPWAEAGYECWCVDICHPIRQRRIEGNIHFVYGDIRSWTPAHQPISPSAHQPISPSAHQPIIFVAAFPPCTHLAVSGARDFTTKGLSLLCDSLELFNASYLVASWSGAPFIVENPVGVLSSHFRKPDYIFNPCDYGGYEDGSGDSYTKKTCLWAGNGFIMPPPKPIEAIQGSLIIKLSNTEGRALIRSATPKGFARAVYEANAPA